MEKWTEEILAPVAWLPAGLVSWYAAGGMPVVLVTSWVALVGGKAPKMRTAWHGGQDSMSRFWPGGDFVYNVPDDECLAKIHAVMRKGRLCLDPEKDLSFQCATGLISVAPRLLDCRVQIECINGNLVASSGVELELCGDVVRLHRDKVVLDPDEVPDLCAIEPLSLV
jgi:flavin reductase (DIM6/NTAB) family NADH-FMN oxidoreductase RutF